MYTREEKVKAVELYIKYGKKAAATIRELGYPCRGQLRTWYKEYEENGGSIPEHTLEKYTPEQKRAAVVCLVNPSFHKRASLRFTHHREDSSRMSMRPAHPALSS